MAYEQKPGDFTLYKNDFKTEDKHPDYKGRGLDLTGNPIEIAAWIKSGANGKFMSCRMSVPRRDEAPAKPAAKPQRDDSEIPF